ncbi:MAG: zinc ribbon domain-containing protein [Verrucomicrobiia bacterium]|jgi:hypothetical protein
MDITFNCDKCGQSLTIDEAGAGQLVDCPKCGKPLEVPYRSTPLDGAARASLRPATTEPLGPSPTTSDTKKCPFCAETIKLGARVCRFCGYDLVKGQPPVRSTEPASNPLSKILAVLVIIAAMVGGYFAYHFWRDQPLATTLEGEVFIVTKGGQNYKLGLVTVGIEKAEVLRKYLDEVKHDPDVVKRRKAYEAAGAAATAALDNWKKLGMENDGFPEYEEAQKKASEALDAYEDFLVNVSLSFEVFSAPHSTKTDADGHYTMPVPGPGSFVLTARAERDVGDKVEHYYWFLPLPPPDRGKIKMTLSNDNLTSPAKIVDFGVVTSSP